MVLIEVLMGGDGMRVKKAAWGLNSFVLHLLAMALMLADHLWAIGVPPDLLTWLGRLAFPLFAFMLVEGYVHTRNLKKYIRRLLITAVITELPFNLLCSGGLFYPLHQNVIWSFLISLLCIQLIDRARRKLAYAVIERKLSFNYAVEDDRAKALVGIAHSRRVERVVERDI